MEILVNEPYKDGPGAGGSNSGQFTHKVRITIMLGWAGLGLTLWDLPGLSHRKSPARLVQEFAAGLRSDGGGESLVGHLTSFCFY